MLSNLIKSHLDIKPIKTNPIDSLIFTRDGSIKPNYLKICEKAGINPEELIFKPLESYGGKTVAAPIKILRFNHYENKRQGTLMRNYLEIWNPVVYEKPEN